MVTKIRGFNPEKMETVRTMIREAGLRATPARIAALQRLRAAPSPLTHSDLVDLLVSLGFDQATVFQNLSNLSEAGRVSRTQLRDHVWRFDAIDPDLPDKGAHPHFVCIECGRVECLDAMKFTAKSKHKATTVGRITAILLKGECSNYTDGTVSKMRHTPRGQLTNRSFAHEPSGLLIYSFHAKPKSRQCFIGSPTPAVRLAKVDSCHLVNLRAKIRSTALCCTWIKVQSATEVRHESKCNELRKRFHPAAANGNMQIVGT